MHLDNTAAIVTGAASGLGAATAAHLADRGATVYGLDLEKAVACVVPSAGVHLVPADVTDDEQVRAAVGRIRYHGQQLRLAVNCAGIAPSARILSRNGPHDLDPFHNVLKVNLLGTFNVLRLAAEAMSELTPTTEASAASSSTPPRSPPTRPRSGRSPTPPPRPVWPA